jgi:hypothetical protein
LRCWLRLRWRPKCRTGITTIIIVTTITITGAITTTIIIGGVITATTTTWRPRSKIGYSVIGRAQSRSIVNESVIARPLEG